MKDNFYISHQNRNGLIPGIGISAIALLLFAVIADNVISNPRLAAIDIALSQWLHLHAAAWLTEILMVITNLHRPLGIIIMSLLPAVLLLRSRQWRWLAMQAIVIPGGLMLNGLLKQLFHRLRPVFDAPLMTLNSYSFPSGHVLGSTLFYGLLVVFLFSRTTDWRWRTLALLGAGLMVVLIAFTRIYLGVHYLSDTLGAMAEGIAWLALCITIGQKLETMNTVRVSP